MFMATKTLTIMEDAYEMLAKRKGKDESFSEVIRRVVGGEKKKSIMELAGAWSHLSDEEVERRKTRIYEMRRKGTQELLKRRARLWKR